MIGQPEVYSNVTESLNKIREAHWETGNEVNSKSGAAIMYATRAAMNTKKTHWSIKYVNGKRRFVYSEKTRTIGEIVNRSGTILNTRLQNLVQYRTYSTKGTTVVVAAMKSGTTEIRENGKVVGSTRVDSVGSGSIDILQKLNYGLNSTSSAINMPSGSRAFDWQGKSSRESFKGKHKKMNFVEEGRRNAMGKVTGYINRGFEEALARRSNIKTKTVKVA